MVSSSSDESTEPHNVTQQSNDTATNTTIENKPEVCNSLVRDFKKCPQTFVECKHDL